ncbi:MAG: protein kinase, partial [Phycisphaerales bacterium]|nr:protein kinase [Phycisphaerales bacterium]
GMGVVYEAEQDATGRRVAVKVVRADLVTPGMVRRFEQERRLLAQLSHPGIARIYEAGSVVMQGETLPCFVMELVEGQPITRHARDLAIAARVEMLASVADAVHHAHQRGVIHRDLKPANVLVEAEGMPKVLDFGVARLVDDAQRGDARTEEGIIPGTLPWMSPEQVAGAPGQVDIRTDVYALGVIAYEVLTGVHPFDEDDPSLAELVVRIQHRDATPPGAHARALRGDLEVVIARAMAKDPQRRYGSASDFAADLRRFLANEPVQARPADAAYRLRKFARRNPALVTVGTIAAVMLMLATVVSALQARSAMRARAESERQLRLQRELTSFFIGDVLMQSSPAHEADRDITLREVLDRASQRIETELAQEPELQAEIRSAIGNAYYALDVGESASGHLEAVVGLLTDLRGPDDPATLRARHDLARAWGLQSRHSELLEACDDIIARQSRVLGADHADTLSTRLTRAQSTVWLGRFDEARSAIEAVLQAAPGAWGVEDERTWEARWLLAYVRLLLSRFEAGAPLAREVLARRQARFGEEHPATLEALELVTYFATGLGDVQEALESNRRLYEIRARVLGATHFQSNNALAALGASQYAAGDADAGYASLMRAITERAATDGEAHPSTNAHRVKLARCLLDQDGYEEARALSGQAAEALRGALGEGHTLTLEADRIHGLALLGLGRAEEAEPLLTGVAAACEPGSMAHARAQVSLGLCLVSLGRGSEGREAVDAGYRRLTELLPAGSRDRLWAAAAHERVATP